MTHPALAIPLGVLLLILAVPALLAGRAGLRGRLDRNSKLGVHSPPAMASEQAFILANRVAAPLSLASGGVLSVGTVLLLILRTTTPVLLVLFAVCLVGGLALQVLAGRMGTAAARQVRQPATGGDCGTGVASAAGSGSAGPGGCCGGCACGPENTEVPAG